MTEVVKQTNAELRQNKFSHARQDFTFKRNEQREVETLALAEAMGEWMTRLLHEEGVTVRGAEGFFDDIANGVVLCKVLRKLGVPCEVPRDPPRNDFDIKENKQKFQRACIRAKFLSIPSFDRDAATGLMPTLLECAAVNKAESDRRHEETILPDAISKRTANLPQSEAIRDAIAGRVVATGDPTPAVAKEAQLVDTSGVRASTVSPGKAIAVAEASTLAPAVTTEPIARRVAPESKPIVAVTRTDRARTVSKEESGGDVATKRRTRTASEIPKEEKDQIVNVSIALFVFFLFLLYMLR